MRAILKCRVESDAAGQESEDPMIALLISIDLIHIHNARPVERGPSQTYLR